jgi:hypothetical protein
MAGNSPVECDSSTIRPMLDVDRFVDELADSERPANDTAHKAQPSREECIGCVDWFLYNRTESDSVPGGSNCNPAVSADHRH